MAEVTGFRNNALPFPVYGVPFAIVFPILDISADYVTGAAGLDTEVSKNGDAFADATNEATEIGTSGVYYLLLTAAEMTADVVAIKVKTSTTDAKNPLLTLYPRKLVPYRSSTSAGGAPGYIVLDAGAAIVDHYYDGCLCVATIDGNVEARIIQEYTASDQHATVVPDWNVDPDAGDTFIIYAVEGMHFFQSNMISINDNGRAIASFERACAAITRGAVTGGASTTTEINTTGLSPAAGVTDQFKGQILCFDKETTTANLRGQKTTITGSSSGGVLTVTALTTAPAAGDTFVIQ